MHIIKIANLDSPGQPKIVQCSCGYTRACETSGQAQRDSDDHAIAMARINEDESGDPYDQEQAAYYRVAGVTRSW